MKVISKPAILFLIAALAGAVAMFLDPIPQSVAYHSFADKRTILGIPNLLNSISNITFIIAGVIGLFYILTKQTRVTSQTDFRRIDRAPFYTFFISMVLIGIGSFYYHLSPDNFTLVFDRLPMATAFLSFFVIIISERISRKTGRVFFIPFMVLAVFSVLYWYYTETIGVGDLRLYGLVQYLPMLLVIIMLFLYPAHYIKNRDISIILALYGIAKVFEIFDQGIFMHTGFISGHTIKHIIASYVTYWFAQSLKIKPKE